MGLEQVDNKTYVVINLGSSHITGMIARKHKGGRISPIGISRKASNDSIRYGAVHNVDEASRIVGQILDELGQKLNDNEIIKSVYVGVVCKSMQSRVYETHLSLGSEGEIITLDHLQTLRDQAKDAEYSGMEILRVTDPRYYVDGKLESNPKGVRCSNLEAKFQIITVRRSIAANIREVFEAKLGLEIKEILIAPIAEATISLHPEEVMLGSAFVNIGGGTTSISIYEKKLLSALYILPMGGINVTKDLMELSLLERDAETLKLRYGSMNMPEDKKEIIPARSINSGVERHLNRYEVCRYVSARMNEILSNVINIIKLSGLDSVIRSGLVFSGGGTKIDGFLKSMEGESVRQGSARRDFISDAVSDSDLSTYQTEFGLVLLAKEDCIETQIKNIEEVFGPTQSEPEPEAEPTEEEFEEEGHTIFGGDGIDEDDDDSRDCDIDETKSQSNTSAKNTVSRLGSVFKGWLAKINGTEEDDED